MTVSEKFAAFTTEDKERLAAVTDMESLVAFFQEHDIELPQEDMQGILEAIRAKLVPMEDDELDVAAGGPIADMRAKKKEAHEQAKADGRTEHVNAFNFLCICSSDYKWAREVEYGFYKKTFYDIKCYKCGKTWDKKVMYMTP